ncbi:MAG: hypothetical protein KDA89_17810, partial [Planctomycetaceae bacterium]|nr:hypothetical protein [Planctomycetaceae bacterium]
RLLQELTRADNAVVRSDATELCVQTLLTELSARRFPSAQIVPALPVADVLQQLRQLPLTDAQRLQTEILSRGTDGSAAASSPVASPEDLGRLLQSTGDTLLNLGNDWTVRADILTLATVPPDMAAAVPQIPSPSATTGFSATTQQVGSAADTGAFGRVPLSVIEIGTLFPDRIPEFSAQSVEAPTASAIAISAGADSPVSRLLRNDDTVREHLLLSQLLNAADQSQPDGNAVAELRQQLAELRGTKPAPSTLPAARLRAWEVTAEETFSLLHDSRVPELAQDGRRIDTPAWYRDRMFLIRDSVVRMEADSGAVTTPHHLPAAAECVPGTPGFAQPGIVPLIGDQSVGVLSLTQAGGPSVRWWRTFRPAAVLETPVEVGPVGPGYMILSTPPLLSCLHPLTGRLLWQRRVEAGVPQRLLYRNAVRLAGDHRVVGILGHDLKGCGLFDTRTGEELGTCELNITGDQVPLILGRRLLYQSGDDLVLADLLSGRNELKTSVKLQHPGAVVGHILDDMRAVLYTEDSRALIINMVSGEVEIDCVLRRENSSSPTGTGIRAVRSRDRILLLIKNWDDGDSGLAARSRIDDVQMDSGTLYCLDPVSGESVWSRDSFPSVWPEVQGDPSGFRIAWTWREARDRPDHRFSMQTSPERSLQILLIDDATGMTIAHLENLGPYEPLTCFHDAEKQTFTMETDHSVIKIRYQAVD